MELHNPLENSRGKTPCNRQGVPITFADRLLSFAPMKSMFISSLGSLQASVSGLSDGLGVAAVLLLLVGACIGKTK